MRSFTVATSVFALASVAAARRCHNVTLPVEIEAQNALFNLTIPANDIEVTDFILNITRPGDNFGATITEGEAMVSGSFEISAQYCEPDHGKPDILQILTHGIGFDKSYWDFPLDDFNLSYVKQAVDCQGYATLAYDRLGFGNSSIEDPLNKIQAELEIAALKEITRQMRAGSAYPHAVKGKKFDKVIHIGHSFGSVQTYGLAATDPELTDAIILTGFSQDLSSIPIFALSSGFIQAGEVNERLSVYPPGYFVPAAQTGLQTNFFAPNSFDPAVLEFAFANVQPVAIGELLTFGGPVSVVNNFTGPCLIVTGELDVPFCGGNCLNTAEAESIPALANVTLPDVKNFEAFIVPGTNHGLNLAFTAPITYKRIFDYLEENDLAPRK